MIYIVQLLFEWLLLNAVTIVIYYNLLLLNFVSIER